MENHLPRKKKKKDANVGKPTPSLDTISSHNPDSLAKVNALLQSKGSEINPSV